MTRERERADLVRDLEDRGITDERVLAAMLRVPREAFVPADLTDHAYDDGPLPIGDGQTISQPFVVALMAEAGGIAPDARVLEVGTGSGYGAAVLAELAREVHTIERIAWLAHAADERLAALGYTNVRVHVGDGSLGWPPSSPYDAILVAAGGPSVPLALVSELAIGGALVIPVGNGRMQRLLRVTRTGDSFIRDDLGAVHFVPLIGMEAWDGEARR
ncbi:MAG TPA: protein-L-isoaspartate(D-aspartate) O-methyltransferase [Kofleriaceae bacterium]|jgi:protein-L-isoaspartate(D-aspartate) O-methyltransferase|nr:protein-L-isoaspartate(D-aspartate) O-methyltransferase [Kofleriaceae bacterium]